MWLLASCSGLAGPADEVEAADAGTDAPMDGPSSSGDAAAWVLRDAGELAPRQDPPPAQPCVARTTRVRPDLPELLLPHPHSWSMVAAGDGSTLGVVYRDAQDFVFRFALIDAETGEVTAFWTQPAPVGAHPHSLRRLDAGRWELMWRSAVNGALVGGIDIWSRDRGFVARVETWQTSPAYQALQVVRRDDGFVLVGHPDPTPDPPGHVSIVLVSGERTRAHVPSFPDLRADDMLQIGRIVPHGDDGIAATAQWYDDEGHFTRVAFTMDDLSTDAPRTTSRVLERWVGSDGIPNAVLDDTPDGYVVTAWGHSPRVSDGIRYTWLADDLTPIAEWSAVIPGPGDPNAAFVDLIGIAGRYPFQALLALVIAGPFSSVILGVASAPGEVEGGLTVVANGVEEHAARAAWESSDRGYSFLYWRAGLEVVTFHCDDEP